jgi:hypothetical protein
MDTGNEQNLAPSPEAIEAGYETSTVSIKGLTIFFVCLIVVAAVIHLGVWFLFGDFVKHDERAERSRSALDSTTVLPPPPRLQPTPGVETQNVPAADLQQMYQKEDAVFSRMGWTIDVATHEQTVIPPTVVSAVIADESARQEHPQQPISTKQPAPDSK